VVQPSLLAYITRRLIALVPTIVLMSIVVFSMTLLIPGDAAQVILGTKASPEARQELRRKLGMDRSIPEQYLIWASKVVRGDWGYSIRTGRPVLEMVIERLPATLLLASAGTLIGIVIAMPLGVLAALKRNTAVDTGAMIVALSAVSMPSFWLGLVLILAFALSLGWLPSTGYASLTAQPLEALKFLALPALTLGASMVGAVARNTRSALLEELGRDYVRTARAKGLRERTVLNPHVFRNAAVTVVTVIGLQFAYLLGGDVIVEQIFLWPGIGRLAVTAILDRDFPLVQGVVLVAGLMLMLANLLVDMTYRYIDPRIRAT
jgi:peptide/nickel transport system permease protein